jgi:hypothetical protein
LDLRRRKRKQLEEMRDSMQAIKKHPKKTKLNEKLRRRPRQKRKPKRNENVPNENNESKKNVIDWRELVKKILVIHP